MVVATIIFLIQVSNQNTSNEENKEHVLYHPTVAHVFQDSLGLSHKAHLWIQLLCGANQESV